VSVLCSIQTEDGSMHARFTSGGKGREVDVKKRRYASVTTCCRAFSTGPLKFKPVKNVGFNVLAVLGALLHTAFESWYFTVWLKAD
jgi:hypothetical protein